MTLNAQAKNIPVRVRKYHHSNEKGLQKEGKKEEVKRGKKKEGKICEFQPNEGNIATTTYSVL